MRKLARLCLALSLFSLPGCGDDEEDAGPTGAAYGDQALDIYSIELDLPFAEGLELAAERPAEPVVLTNLLVFRDQAIGEGFEGLTGAEAYALYGLGLVDLMTELGSRMVWNGDVLGHTVGTSDPEFEGAAFIEYADPNSFLLFGARGSGDAPEARSAGLLGQWLLATTPLDEPDPAQIIAEATPPDDGDLARSGLSDAQQEDVRAAATVAPIFVIELLGYSDGPEGSAAAPYRAAWRAAVEEQGGTIIFRGQLDTWLLGEAGPAFHEVVLTLGLQTS